MNLNMDIYEMPVMAINKEMSKGGGMKRNSAPVENNLGIRHSIT